MGFDFALFPALIFTKAFLFVYKWIFCIEMSCVYSTAQNDKAAKFEE
jgi:hypothetical protein